MHSFMQFLALFLILSQFQFSSKLLKSVQKNTVTKMQDSYERNQSFRPSTSWAKLEKYSQVLTPVQFRTLAIGQVHENFL